MFFLNNMLSFCIIIDELTLCLQKIPQGDWFCQKCKPNVKNQPEEDEPEEKV